ncbi:MAG: glucuronate isomerase [Chitinophagaceae bacterium]|nr:glucuronate isomerase [Chitinophagaceae bacterium]
MNYDTNHIKGSSLQFKIKDNFMLGNSTAQKLYEVAKRLPVIDPHNHVDPAALAENKPFENIYQLWIKPDQYKNRVMRQLGIHEKLITGSSSDYEKYMAWVQSLQHTIGNPIFHWSCMELKILFRINEVLTVQNAEQIWHDVNALLQKDEFSPVNIVKKFGVELLCTSDDLLDSLEHHIQFKNQQEFISCLPSLRGDSILAFQQPQYKSWLARLEAITGIQIENLELYKEAVAFRLNFFDEVGCLLSDHSLDTGFQFILTDETTAAELFVKVLQNENLAESKLVQLQSYMLNFLGVEYAKRKWKMQLHIGANRFTSSRLREVAGPAGGYACIGNTVNVPSLCRFLDSLDINNHLPKTILYNLNPGDNAVFASLSGSFSEDGVQGKIQFGPAWWFNDHEQGITQQLITLSSYGLLGTSIGMTTDSRSILSFVRHDYFRRILCNLLGGWAEDSKIPADINFLTPLVENISYHNIKNWIKK